MEQEQKPKVGLGVMIFKGGKILVGKRKSFHGQGQYAWPGGHLEHMESFEDCARRETREEAGIEITNIRFQFLANMKKYAPKHYVHVNLMADWLSGEPKVLEPEKLESWEWREIDNLPTPLFETCILAVDSLRTGRNYYDA